MSKGKPISMLTRLLLDINKNFKMRYCISFSLNCLQNYQKLNLRLPNLLNKGKIFCNYYWQFWYPMKENFIEYLMLIFSLAGQSPLFWWGMAALLDIITLSWKITIFLHTMWYVLFDIILIVLWVILAIAYPVEVDRTKGSLYPI